MDSDRRDLVVIHSFILVMRERSRLCGVEWNGVIFRIFSCVYVYMETSIDEPQDQPNGKRDKTTNARI